MRAGELQHLHCRTTWSMVNQRTVYPTRTFVGPLPTLQQGPERAGASTTLSFTSVTTRPRVEPTSAHNTACGIRAGQTAAPRAASGLARPPGGVTTVRAETERCVQYADTKPRLDSVAYVFSICTNQIYHSNDCRWPEKRSSKRSKVIVIGKKYSLSLNKS